MRVLDYAAPGINAIIAKAAQAGLADRLAAEQHDVRQPLPLKHGDWDACYSHILFCMAFTTPELEALVGEVRRVPTPQSASPVSTSQLRAPGEYRC